MKFLIFGILGFLLIAVDLMFIPGGLLVVVGSGLLVYSVYLNFVANGIWAALLEIAIVLAMLPSLIRYSLNRLALKKEMRAEDGFVGVEDYSRYLKQTGRAITDLRPSGTVVLDDNEAQTRLDCIAEGGYIEAGEPVEVVASRGPSLVVRRRKTPVEATEDQPA